MRCLVCPTGAVLLRASPRNQPQRFPHECGLALERAPDLALEISRNERSATQKRMPT